MRLNLARILFIRRLLYEIKMPCGVYKQTYQNVLCVSARSNKLEDSVSLNIFKADFGRFETRIVYVNLQDS